MMPGFLPGRQFFMFTNLYWFILALGLLVKIAAASPLISHN
jgi:hypothetical protein